MKSIDIPITTGVIQTEGRCRDNSFYTRFTDDDIDELTLFASDLGYALEPEIMDADPDHTVRLKIISKTNPSVYGWIAKVKELKDGAWQDTFLYGFIRHGRFICKYPITFNIQSHNMRGIIRRKTKLNPRQEAYYRTIFGILDLEPPVNPLTFILSWLTACNFSKIATT